jgi:hypothetical protein
MTKQPILPEDNYVCPAIPSESLRFGRLRKNYISASLKVKAITICRFKRARLERRVKKVGNNIVTKPPSRVRSVLIVQDYRHPAQFDDHAFYANPEQRPSCLPVPAHNTARFVRTARGKHALDEVKVLG